MELGFPSLPSCRRAHARGARVKWLGGKTRSQGQSQRLKWGLWHLYGMLRVDDIYIQFKTLLGRWLWTFYCKNCMATVPESFNTVSPSLFLPTTSAFRFGNKKGAPVRKQTHHLSQLPALSPYLHISRISKNILSDRDSICSFPSWKPGTKFRAMTMSIQWWKSQSRVPGGPIWN